MKSKWHCILFHGYRCKYKFFESIEPDPFVVDGVNVSNDYVVTYRKECSCGRVEGSYKERLIGYNSVFNFGHKNIEDAELADKVRLFRKAL